MDLSTVNLQAEFRKLLFGYLEVVVNSTCKFRNSKLLYGDLGMELLTVNLQNNCKLNFENQNCCMEIWEWTSHYSTCKINFENRNCSMEIWEWTSQQLTCKLN